MAEENKEKKKKGKKEKTFEQKLLSKERPYNFLVAGFMTVYLIWFSGLAEEIGFRKLSYFLTISLAVVILLQYLVAPFTNHLTLSKATKLINEEKTEESTIESRTNLVKALMDCPRNMMINVFCVFAAGISILAIILYKFFTQKAAICEFYIISGLVSSYFAALVGHSYTETVCSKYAIPLIKEGLDVNVIQKDKFYGYSLFMRETIFVSAMAVLTNIMVFYFYINCLRQNYQGYSSSGLYGIQSVKMTVMLLVHLIISGIAAFVVYWQISNSYKHINATLEKLLANVEEKEAFLPTDLSNNFSYNYFLINEIILNLHDMVAKVLGTSQSILDATASLSVTSRETAETAVEEASSVKECLVAMEGLSAILTQISNRIYNVSVAAADTKIDVDDGYTLLHTEIIEKKINEITNSNIETILGIKDFGEKIGNVWNIINTIDSVAEKTKIIAFNAELEATEAGEKGDTFHIIANEIRRLATTITDSTQRIKAYIQSIQEFSDNLIVTSEVGTQKIREGSRFFSELEEKFSDLRTATDITAESAMSIQEIADTQGSAFDQISGTFEQISVGFDQFAQAAQYVNKVAENLSGVSEHLKLINLKDKYYGYVETEEK